MQADSRSAEIYKKLFGIETVEVSENELSLQPIEGFQFPKEMQLDMNNCPDIAQTVCVTAAALDIPFILQGWKH